MNELQPLFDRYKAAVYAKDVDAFVSMFDTDVHVFDMWGGADGPWSHRGIAAWRAMAVEWFESLGDERVEVEFEDIQASAAGDVGYATAYVTFTRLAATGERLRSLQNRMTWVARQGPDGWKIVHEHTSAPVDHARGKVILKR